jgi:hypothetical protein
MSKRNKFDLTNLVHHGVVPNSAKLAFVSDPSKTCTVHKMPNNEYKVLGRDGKPTTIHAFVQECLGQEVPDHASKWLKTPSGKTLYELWQEDIQDEAA